jgi:hypothetical protein
MATPPPIKGKPRYADLGDVDEDTRIRVIGEAVMRLSPGGTVAFVTDADPGKADRYIKKLTSRFPEVVVLGRFKGPVKGSVTVKVGRKLH